MKVLGLTGGLVAEGIFSCTRNSFTTTFTTLLLNEFLAVHIHW